MTALRTPSVHASTATGRAIRWSTVLAVAGIAFVAGWISYEHALTVVRAHGEDGVLANLYPGTVDGLIYAASMVLLDSARRSVKAPALARWLLAGGIGATLFANVLAGIHYGLLGAVVAAWPALALVGSYELLMYLVRSGAKAEAETVLATVTEDVPAPVAVTATAPESTPAVTEHEEPVTSVHVAASTAQVPVTEPVTASTPERAPKPAGKAAGTQPKETPEVRAERLFRGDIEAGRVPGIRAIKTAVGCGTPTAQRIRAHLETLAREKAFAVAA